MKQFIVVLSFAMAACTGSEPRSSPNERNATLGEPFFTGDCSADRQRIVSHVMEALASQFRPSCESDSDCTIVDTSVYCQESCPTVVASTRRDAYLAALQQWGAENCPSLNADACTGVPECYPHMVPRCTSLGVCVPHFANLGETIDVPDAGGWDAGPLPASDGG